MADPIRFDDAAAMVVSEAHGLAARLGHVTSDVPHLLWAIIAKGSPDIRRVLGSLGSDPDQLLRSIEMQLPPPTPDFSGLRSRVGVGEQVAVTAAFKAVIDDAGANGNGRLRVGERALLSALLAAPDAGTRSLLDSVGLQAGSGPAIGSATDDPEQDGDAELLRLIGQYGRVLTEEARAGLLDPVVGRTAELRRLGYILGRRRKNNPVLLGEPGVGKTAIVEGFAQAIVDGNVPAAVAGKHIIALDVGSLVAGTKYRGEFEERIQELLAWLAAAGDSIILFVDEVHLLSGAGSAEGAIDAASFFKPQLARGEVRMIGATTVAEYRRHIVHDGALERRFQPVFVAEPTVPETIAMLRGLRGKYEDFHGVAITDAALEAAVKVSLRRLPERRFPDKAIDLIDEAASRTRARADAASGKVDRATALRTGGQERLAGVEVTPADVIGVVEEWVRAGGTTELKRDVYSLSRFPGGDRLRRLTGRRSRSR